MAKDNDSGKKLALGALIAGAAGYITGILTAPKSGKDTRQDISDKASDVKSEAEAKLQEAHDELSDAVAASKDKAESLGSKAKEELNETIARAKDAQSKAAELLKSVRAGKADDPSLDKAIKQAKQARKNLGKYLKG